MTEKIPPAKVPPLAPTDTPNGGASQSIASHWWETSNWWQMLPEPCWAKLKKITLTEKTPWYEVYEVHPNIYAMYEPGHFQQVMSYLIIGIEKAMLLDTGMDIYPINKVVDQLTKLPVFVVNTHAHADHVGGNYLYNEIYGVDNEWATSRSKGRSHQDLAIFWEKRYFINNTWPDYFVGDQYVINPYTVTHYVKEGDKFNMGNRVLEVIDTPGHSPDCISLIDRQNRLLFVGDVFYDGPLYAFLPETDVAEYTRTAEKLAGIASQVDEILSHHNNIPLPSFFLAAMSDAFKAINAGTATDFRDAAGLRSYNFDGFVIQVTAPN